MGISSSKEKEDSKYKGYEMHTDYKDEPGIDFPCPLCHYQLEYNETVLKCARCTDYASHGKVFTEEAKKKRAEKYPVPKTPSPKTYNSDSSSNIFAFTMIAISAFGRR